VQPGDVSSIEAAIWFSDLRGFTQLSSQLETRALIATLNDYFAAISVPIAENGGEILKFIGDAVLVIFPVTEKRNAAAACSAAVAAAIAAGKTLDTLNLGRKTKNLPPLSHGIGLHFGRAEYGNIGAPGRLDFTVIGSDVNQASRVEGLCGKLGYRLLATQDVAKQVPENPWKSLGDQELKGIARAIEVFALE
jgi:adenylate cyclase